MLKLQIIGHIGKDAVVKAMTGGKSVINFNVAHTTKYKDAQGVNAERTTWVQCEYWTEKTAVAQYLTKGKQVFVEGEPTTDYYNAGAQGLISVQKCRVREIQLLGGGGQRQEGQQQGQQPGQANQAGDAAAGGGWPGSDISPQDDDLPF